MTGLSARNVKCRIFRKTMPAPDNPDQIVGRRQVEELCKAFVLYREGKGLDKATLSEDRYISRRLQKHLRGHMAHELGVAEIRSFLDTAKASHALEHKLYKVGSLIFAYGKEQRVLVLNPFDEIDRPKVAYTVP
jgi:hypothetical protein